MSLQTLRKNRNKLILFLLPVFVILCGCTKGGIDKEPLVVFNQNVSPGEIVYLKISGTDSSNIKELKVTIGDQAASVLGMKNGLVQVFVPNLKPGKAKVKVITRESKSLEAEVNIMESLSKNLYLTFKDKKITYVKSAPSNNKFERFNDKGSIKKLSYEIYSEKNELLVSGTAVYPGSGMEYFDKDGKINRTDYQPSGDFVLNIPNIPGMLIIKFYEADEKTDLLTEKGLSARKLINEITIKN